MGPDISEGYVSRLAIKYLTGYAIGMMFGVSKESHTIDELLGYLK